MPVIGNPASGGKKPTTPTIGTAADGGTGTTVSVPFTPSSYIGKGTITYTAVSNPGSISATGSGSPITVSGLTTGTSYTFTVKGDTNYGVASDFSAASNSVTPVVPGAFESIASINGDGSNSSFTFSSIPQTYKHLQLRMVLSSNQSTPQLRINGQSNTAYRVARIRGGNGSATSSADAASNFGALGCDTGGSATSFSGYIVDIMDYTATDKNKIFKSFSGNPNLTVMELEASTLNAYTPAITSIRIDPGVLTTTSRISLYGIKG